VVLRLSRWGVSVSVTYKLRFSADDPTLTFKNGMIEISGRVEAETSTFGAPNGYVQFKQKIGLTLETSRQTVRLERIGDPDVDESWFIPHGTAVNIVKSEIDNALSANKAGVEGIFLTGRVCLPEG
jgi:hypothetical protein